MHCLLILIIKLPYITVSVLSGLRTNQKFRGPFIYDTALQFDEVIAYRGVIESEKGTQKVIFQALVVCHHHAQALDDWTHFFFFFFFFFFGLHLHPFGDPYDMFMQLFYL